MDDPFKSLSQSLIGVIINRSIMGTSEKPELFASLLIPLQISKRIFSVETSNGKRSNI